MRKQNCRKCIQLDDTLKSLIFIYFTTITKQVIQLILIMLVGTDVCVRMVFVWEETGVLGGNPPVWLGDHMTISHVEISGIVPGSQRWEASVLTDDTWPCGCFLVSCMAVWVTTHIKKRMHTQSCMCIKTCCHWIHHIDHTYGRHIKRIDSILYNEVRVDCSLEPWY